MNLILFYNDIIFNVISSYLTNFIEISYRLIKLSSRSFVYECNKYNRCMRDKSVQNNIIINQPASFYGLIGDGGPCSGDGGPCSEDVEGLDTHRCAFCSASYPDDVR